ncbi:hypothetical protein GIB67_033961 [Kingdonia uniflora]|uniref:RING-type domain-containing protein n=1 Tax=Kingdonia uniflora TaxID=39325 RepID=A0A7J7NKY3_9MAGN|nr:hypothetical protein GIB67_033961 [Kingdonia uniflora]
MFFGDIPDKFENLSKLYDIIAEYNQFSDKIPKSIVFCERLTILGLVGNRLDGNIPKEIFELSYLRDLRLARNSLSGSFPIEVGGLKQVGFLDISNNQLAGASWISANEAEGKARKNTYAGTRFNRRLQPYSNITGDVQLHKPPGSAADLTEPCCLTASLMTEGNTALKASSRGKKAYDYYTLLASHSYTEEALVCITNLESIISEDHADHVSVTQAFVEIHLKSVLEVRRLLNHELLIRYDDPIEVIQFSIDFFGFLTELGRDKLIQDLCTQTKSWSNNLIGEEFWVNNRDTFLQISLDAMLDTLLRESEGLTMKLELDIVTTVQDYADPGVAIITLAMDSRTTINLSGTTPGETAKGRDKICPIYLDYYAEGQNVTTTQCGHKFHLECILQWISISHKMEYPYC